MKPLSLTKDELFLVRLYEADQVQPGMAHNRYLIGKKANLSHRPVNAICALLVRANFIKKGEEEDLIVLTPHGAALAQQLTQGKYP